MSRMSKSTLDRTRQARILVVDDEADVRLLTNRGVNMTTRSRSCVKGPTKINEASTGFRPWYPSFLWRNPPKHPPSLSELRRVSLAHSSTDLRPWSSAKADKEREAGISRIAATVIAIVGVMSVFIFAACETKEKSRALTAAPTPVETLSPDQIITVGDISKKTPAKKLRRFVPLANYLPRHLKNYGIESGKVVIARNVEEMARLLKDGTVDIYFDSPFPALAVQDLSASEFILRRWKKGDPTFWSTFVALRASGITSTEDFVGKVMVFEKPDSTGGFALPAGTLIRRGFTLTEVTSPDAKVAPDEIGYLFSGHQKNTIELIL